MLTYEIKINKKTLVKMLVNANNKPIYITQSAGYRGSSSQIVALTAIKVAKMIVTNPFAVTALLICFSTSQ